VEQLAVADVAAQDGVASQGPVRHFSEGP
jgi:hypothetical protein